ncbi:helix-turn-helix domain-containing protein [Microbacterium betulae]|uniref:Helix-turn-helix domain-containing protein n=1 Tax=Microbacterium betulae TaxID=2981139 RepID=A0AA97FIG1_9MICO|nr:helix-turn-helix domain-containing protein [Microbacterium sp. AB]WOF23298.1 helix-turn-helix domain-containing protein [Microbacterium sp. AB]
MRGSENDGSPCDAAVALAFSVLGKRWNGMILDALSRGALSFVALRRAVTGISDAVLSDRLSELASVELVRREVNAGPPVSVTYVLTPAGEHLIPALAMLGEWASENLRVTRA